MEAERHDCLSQGYFANICLCYTFDETHNERDMIESTKDETPSKS